MDKPVIESGSVSRLPFAPVQDPDAPATRDDDDCPGQSKSPTLTSRAQESIEVLDAENRLDLYFFTPAAFAGIDFSAAPLAAVNVMRLPSGLNKIPPVLSTLPSLTSLQIDRYQGTQLDVRILTQLRDLFLNRASSLTFLLLPHGLHLHFQSEEIWKYKPA